MSEIGLGKRVWPILGKQKVCSAERMAGCCLTRGVGVWVRVAAEVGSGALRLLAAPRLALLWNCSALWLKALLFKHNVARFPFIWKWSNRVMCSGVQ